MVLLSPQVSSVQWQCPHGNCLCWNDIHSMCCLNCGKATLDHEYPTRLDPNVNYFSADSANTAFLPPSGQHPPLDVGAVSKAEVESDRSLRVPQAVEQAET